MKMPKMPWSKGSPRVSSYSPSKKSTLDKMSGTSKRWWNKTTAALDPYPDPEPTINYSQSDSEKPKSNWFSGKSKKQESNDPRTANELLGYPRLQ